MGIRLPKIALGKRLAAAAGPRLPLLLLCVLTLSLSAHSAASGSFNALHAALHGASADHGHGDGKESSPSSRHCDLCLKLSTLDLGSIAGAPVFRLVADSFAKVVPENQRGFSRGIRFAWARGPPSLA